MNPQPDKASSTDYGTSSFEERMADVTEEALGIQATSPEPGLEGQAEEGEGEGISQDLLGMAFDDALIDSEKEFQDSLLDSEREFQSRLHRVFCKFPLSTILDPPLIYFKRRTTFLFAVSLFACHVRDHQSLPSRRRFVC